MASDHRSSDLHTTKQLNRSTSGRLRSKNHSTKPLGSAACAARTKQQNNNTMAKELKELTKRADNYSQWYNDLVVKADLAEQSAVRGCMVIKPYGYAISEKTQQQLDNMFK